MSDRNDSIESRPAPASEGVRILGAEEAQAVVDQRDRELAPDTPPTLLDLNATTDETAVVPAADPTPAPARVVHFPDNGPTWSATDDPDTDVPEADLAEAELEVVAAVVADDDEVPTGEIPPLPHWTEPPTGAVPAIFADDDDAESDPDLAAWSAITGSQPRFRAEGSDWAEADFPEEELVNDAVRIGALAEATPVDDDQAFEEEFEKRRRRTPRGRPARQIDTPAPRPARAESEPVPAAPPSGRDLPTAIATAGVIVVVAFLCFNAGTFWTALLCSVIVGLGTLEFTGALQHRGFRPASLLALVASFALPVAAREYGTDAYPVFFAVIVLFAMLWFLWEVTPGRPLIGVATTVLAFGYVGGLGGFAGLILRGNDGVGIIIGVVACVVAYDVIGFFVGSQFGKSPIAPKVSPNKTFEGTVAGMIAAVIVGWLIIGGGLLGDGIAPWSPAKGAVLGLFIAAGAFLGDLCESMLKRDLGIKDFGSLLPGHGGVLDRFDALLFCLPIAYFLSVHLDLIPS